MFVVRPFEATTLIRWYLDRDNLDLAPSYQRSSGIWSSSDKAFLIDSVINGYDIPKFYIADFSYVSSELNTSGKPFAVIDGRQRFEAFFDFFEGRFPLNDDIVFLADRSIRLGGLTYDALKERYPKISQRVENFNITVMSVITDEADLINDLFVRLNRSKPLTGAEVRGAMAGPVPAHIRRISAHRFFTENVSFSTHRKQDENTAAKLLLIEHRGSFVETKKITLDRFVREAALTEYDFANSAERVVEVLDSTSNIFVPRDPLLRSSGVVPVLYWLIRNFGNVSNLRNMLAEFEVLRRRDDFKLQSPFVEFNVASRSVNDQASYEARYAALCEFAGLLS